MRSSVLLTSALAAGAIAGPIERRKLITETQVTTETYTVYVTAGQPIPTDADAGNHYSHKSGHRTSSAVAFTSSAAPVPAPEPSSVVPEATSSPPPSVPVVYSTVQIPSSSSTPVPTTSLAPTTTAVPTTSAAPTTTAAPAPSSSSTSQAPAPSSSAPSYGVTHISGEIQATFSSGPDYQNSVLWHHNRARANHGAGNLQWSTECEAAAKTAAEYCDFEHHTVSGQGQNLFTLSGNAYNVTGGITDSWYKGEADIYNWWGQEPPHASGDSNSLDMETFEKYGHATQMLWKGTTHVGCVTIDCGSKMTVGGVASSMGKYTVCNYSPPGNFVGEFAKNVQAPIGSYQGYYWAD